MGKYKYLRRNEQSRELDTGFINKNGWRFNLAKFYHEAVWWWQSTAGDRKRVFKSWNFPKSILNLGTESFRVAPYLFFHLWLFREIAPWVAGLLKLVFGS